MSKSHLLNINHRLVLFIYLYYIRDFIVTYMHDQCFTCDH